MKKEKLLKRNIRLNKSLAWRLESSYRRKLSKGICFTCGRFNEWKDMDCGHFVHSGRGGHWLLDHDERNLRGQCVYCNKYLGGNLVVYANRLETIYGHGIIEELLRLKHQLYVPTNEEVVEKILLLKKLNDELPEM